MPLFYNKIKSCLAVCAVCAEGTTRFCPYNLNPTIWSLVICECKLYITTQRVDDPFHYSDPNV